MDRKEAIATVYGCDVDENKYDYWIPSDAPTCCTKDWRSSEWFAEGSWHPCEGKDRCAHAVHRWPKQQKRWWFDAKGKQVFTDDTGLMFKGSLEITED